MIVKKIKVYLACCLFISCSVHTGYAAPPGSGRPVVQKNFQQLIRTNSCPGCDLAGAVLTRVDLSGADLSGANLAGSKLNLADLSGANLKGANLQGARLGGTDLAGADLTGANLTGAILQGAYLKGAKVDGLIKDTTGETVFVPDAVRSKHEPYSQDVAMEKQQQAGANQQAAGLQDKVKDNKVLRQSVPAPSAGSKHPVAMADVVVPVPAPAPKAIDKKSEKKTIVLDEQNKQPVVKEMKPVVKNDNIPKDTPVSASSGVDKDSAVQDMIARIEADTPGKDTDKAVEKSADKVVSKDEVPSKEVSADGKSAKEVVVNSESSQESTTQKSASGQQKEIGQDKSKKHEAVLASDTVSQTATKVNAAVKTAGGAVAQTGATLEKAGKALLYTVETPAVAAARKQALVDQLLDDDFCVACDLSAVDLSGKRLKGVDLERANLQGADLSDANLSEANLKGADLAGANLKGADLSEADLYKANLSGADLTGADLSEALIDSADFTGAKGVTAPTPSN